VTSITPVFDRGRFAGALAVDLELAQLTETIKRIGLKLPDNGGLKIIIIDAAGQVIAHSEADNLLADVSATLPGIEEVLSSREGSVTAKDRWGADWLYSYTPTRPAHRRHPGRAPGRVPAQPRSRRSHP
jgi:hypothetical protein